MWTLPRKGLDQTPNDPAPRNRSAVTSRGSIRRPHTASRSVGNYDLSAFSNPADRIRSALGATQHQSFRLLSRSAIWLAVGMYPVADSPYPTAITKDSGRSFWARS